MLYYRQGFYICTIPFGLSYLVASSWTTCDAPAPPSPQQGQLLLPTPREISDIQPKLGTSPTIIHHLNALFVLLHLINLLYIRLFIYLLPVSPTKL